MATAMLTVQIPEEIKGKLEALARETHRSGDAIAGDAITDYVTRELKIIEGIHKGLDDMRAGRTVPHEEVMAEIDAIIARAEAARQG